MDDDFVDGLVELIEFGFGDFLDIDDYFIFVELVFIELYFLFECLDEWANGADIMEMEGVVLPGAGWA